MWFVSRADGLVITDPSTGEGLKGTIKASDWKAHLALIQELRRRASIRLIPLYE